MESKIKGIKIVEGFRQEAKLGLALDSVSDYFKLVRRYGFSVEESWHLAKRAWLASEAMIGTLKPMTWQQDASWTKL